MIDNNDIFSELINVSDKQNYSIDIAKKNADVLETIKDMVSVQPEPPVVVVPDTVVIENFPDTQKVEVINHEKVDLTSVEELLSQLVEIVPSIKDNNTVDAIGKLSKLLSEDQSREKTIELLRAILDKQYPEYKLPDSLLSKDGRLKVEVDRAGGGGGGGSTQVDISTLATHAKQDEIITAINSIPGGGGIQYTEGDTDTTITGTAMLFEGAGNTLMVPSSTNPIPVAGTFWQAVQPVSGIVTANTGLSQPLTDTQLRATAVPVSLATLPKDSIVATAVDATASGDTIIVAVTNSPRLYYISLSANGANTTDVTASVKIGTSIKYKVSLKAGSIWARNVGAGRTYITGGAGDDIIVNLSAAQTVHVSVEYADV